MVIRRDPTQVLPTKQNTWSNPFLQTTLMLEIPSTVPRTERASLSLRGCPLGVAPTGSMTSTFLTNQRVLSSPEHLTQPFLKLPEQAWGPHALCPQHKKEFPMPGRRLGSALPTEFVTGIPFLLKSQGAALLPSGFQHCWWGFHSYCSLFLSSFVFYLLTLEAVGHFIIFHDNGPGAGSL